MLRSALVGVFVCAWLVCGQIPGVTPARPEDAQLHEADAKDEAILERTLFGKAQPEDLTPEDGPEMAAAARRIFERRQAQVDRQKKLVDAGAAPRLSLTPLLEELDRSRRTLDLAETRASLLAQLVAIAEREQEWMAKAEADTGPSPLVVRFKGDGLFRETDLKPIQEAYRKQFAAPLPISARGATAVHRWMGFDHRGRVDVALDPDQPQGVWLRQYLELLRIPYYAFRSSVPGRATGPHIHIGPPSERAAHGG